MSKIVGTNSFKRKKVSTSRFVVDFYVGTQKNLGTDWGGFDAKELLRGKKCSFLITPT